MVNFKKKIKLTFKMKLIGIMFLVMGMTIAPIGFLKSTYLTTLSERIALLEEFVQELNKEETEEITELDVAE